MRLDDRYATGSSMMPQKKNPDIPELTRAKAAPSHRPFDHRAGHAEGPAARLQPGPAGGQGAAVRRVRPDAPSARRHGWRRGHGGALRPPPDAGGADSPYLAATDLAEWLVGRGMPFRDAHGLVGGLVRDSLARNVDLAELVAAHPSLGVEAAGLLAPGVAVSRRTSPEVPARRRSPFSSSASPSCSRPPRAASAARDRAGATVAARAVRAAAGVLRRRRRGGGAAPAQQGPRGRRPLGAHRRGRGLSPTTPPRTATGG